MKRRYIQALLPILVPVTVIFTTASPSAGQQTGTPTTILCGAIDMSQVPVELEEPWYDGYPPGCYGFGVPTDTIWIPEEKPLMQEVQI